MLRPSVTHGNSRNAARLSEFAAAAYWSDGVRYAAQRKRFEEKFTDAHKHIVWWSLANAGGVLYFDDDLVCIGVAGTDGGWDFRASADLVDQSLRDWGQATAIPVSGSAGGAVSSAGFLGYTALCYVALEAALDDLRGTKLVDLHGPVWLAGHSLGGAAVQLLQCTQAFEASHAYLYGSPRVFRPAPHDLPERLRVSIRRVTDPVTYVPRRHVHAPAETLYVRYPGSIRAEIPIALQPIVAVYTGLAWTQSLMNGALRQFGLPTRQFFSSHSMAKYRNDLRPFL